MPGYSGRYAGGEVDDLLGKVSGLMRVGLVDVKIEGDLGYGVTFGDGMPFGGGVDVVIVRALARGEDVSDSHLGGSRMGMAFIARVDDTSHEGRVVMSGKVGGVVRIWAGWSEAGLLRARKDSRRDIGM